MKFARDIMSADLGTVTEMADIRVAEILGLAIHVRHIPVVNALGQPTGILSVRDFLSQFIHGTIDNSLTVADVMTKEVVVATPDTEIPEIANIMKQNNISCVPIVNQNKLIGVVTERDFLKLY